MALAALGLAASPGAAFIAPVTAPGASSALRGSIGAEATQPHADVESSNSQGLFAAGGICLLALGAAATRRGNATARRAAKEPKEKLWYGKEIESGLIPRPEDLLESPKFPLYIGGTNGYMSKSTKERHAITWTSKEEAIFEMPTAGFAIMNKGENLCYFRRKEQCIALTRQLRKMKIDNFKIYRIKKDGTVIFMHPADGVFPEKVNKGRVPVNFRPFSAGENPQKASLKNTPYKEYPYECDPLTAMFVKARLYAFDDQENLFPMPQPNEDEFDAILNGEKEEEYQKWREETAAKMKNMPPAPRGMPKSL